jgi:hypothetical protein
MRDAAFAKLLRRLLSPLADSVGLDFYVETLSPGNTPVQAAFAFVGCGGFLLASFMDPECVPSLDKGTQKRVAKAMSRGFGQPGARDAAVFLAQAYAIDLYEFFRFRGDQASGEPQLRFRQLVQQHFPLSDDLVARLDSTRAEYRTLEFHEVRDEVRHWSEMGTAYSRALVDPDFLDGRDPDEDEEAVEIQRRYAGTFLRGHAVLTAIELTIGRELFSAVDEKLMFPGGPDGYDGMVVWQLNDVVWNGTANFWQRAMQRGAGATAPNDDNPDSSFA